MANYDKIIESIKPTKRELHIIDTVNKGIKSDIDKGPFRSDKWYMHFDKVNNDGIELNKAPTNKLLMVVGDSLGTLIAFDRGYSIIRGSVLLKLSNDTIYCFDAKSWGITSGNDAVVYSNNGIFTISTEGVYGKVKEVINIIG